jgi:hypothetical protein
MGIKVVLSEKEASSKALEPVPSGWYKVNISDVELRESKSAKNNGKPYYSFEFTIAEGDHEGRKVFTNAMLWDGALYSIVQIMTALGYEVEAGELEIPEPDDFLGQELMAKVVITPARKVDDKEYDARNDTKGFRSIEQGAPAGNAKPGTSSLLPS